MFYTLKSKMMLTFLLLLVVPFVTMVVIFSEQSKSNVEQITKSSSAQTLDQYAGYLEMLGGQVEDITFQVLGNDLTQQWIQARSGTNQELSRTKQYSLNAQMKDFIAQVTLSHSNVASIEMIDSQGFVIGTDSVYEHVQYESEDWFSYVKKNGPSWLSSHTDPYQPYHLLKEPVNSLVFPLVELKTLTIQGVIKVNIYSSLIKQPLSEIGLFEWSTVHLVNTTGASVTELDNPTVALAHQADEWERLLQTSESKGVVQLKDGDGVRYWFYRKLDLQDWMIVAEITENDLFGQINAIRQTMLVIGGGLLMLTIIAAYWISSGMTRPLSRLSSAMRKLEMGDFSVVKKLDVPSKGEVGYVLHVFERMADRLNRLIHDEFTHKLRKRDAEYKALLMQVNPHFLYNTLEVIGGLAAQNKTDQLINVTESLGQMLRHSLKLNTDIVTLSAELQQLRHYVTIIECRFEDELSIQIEQDPALQHAHIIKFILQPLVENSVKYSREKKNEGIIKITAIRVEQRMILSVEDNGEGMNQQQVNEILHEAFTQDASSVLSSSGSQIGLRNVLARCRLYYGDEFTVQIDSTINQGTKISITLPISEGTDHV